MLERDLMVDGVALDSEYGWILTHHFNMLFNCPVMAVPSGMATGVVQAGIQVVGRTFDDATVFRAGVSFEVHLGGWWGADVQLDPTLGSTDNLPPSALCQESG